MEPEDSLSGMMEAVRTSETSVDNNFTRQYIPEDNSEHYTRRCENLKSHVYKVFCFYRLVETKRHGCFLWSYHICDLMICGSGGTIDDSESSCILFQQ
jgi:NADH:ubiquinone oxidoreductase subunit E